MDKKYFKEYMRCVFTIDSDIKTGLLIKNHYNNQWELRTSSVDVKNLTRNNIKPDMRFYTLDKKKILSGLYLKLNSIEECDILETWCKENGLYGTLVENYISDSKYILKNNIAHRGFDLCYNMLSGKTYVSHEISRIYTIYDLLIEKEKEEKEKEMKFTKDDLKTGMLVEIRSGQIYLLINDTLVGNTDERHWNLSKLETDLTYIDNDEYDIMRVSNIKTGLGLVFEYWNKENILYNMLWERPKEIETITIGDITYEKESVEKLLLSATQIKTNKS